MMKDAKSDASDLVMTQAELPPGIDAPSPPQVRERVTGKSSPDDVEREIRQLAERVGGFPRLRTLVDEFARTGS
jgi:hypothetical protein